MKPLCILILYLVAVSQNATAKEYTLQDQSKGVLEQRAQAMKLRGKVGIIVASDSLRSESGDLAASLLKEAGFTVPNVVTVKNLDVDNSLQRMMNENEVDAILCIGGTGISPHDVTIEAVEGWREKDLPGYGERFRFLTEERWKNHHKELGLMSLDTRTKAVVAKGKIIYAIPGSPDATHLAVTELIIPGLPQHLYQLKMKE
jgi:molybdenum cofactor biosynthesis protein B